VVTSSSYRSASKRVGDRFERARRHNGLWRCCGCVRLTSTRRFLICLSLANLAFLEIWNLLNFGRLLRRLHDRPDLIYYGALADVALLGIALFAADSLLLRLKWYPPLRRFAFVAFVLLDLKILYETVGFETGWIVPVMEILSGGSVTNAVVGLVLIGCLAAAIYAVSRWKRGVSFLISAVLTVSPLFLINVIFAVRMTIVKSDAFKDLPPIQGAKAEPGPRIVWIIFDTFDYHYAFENRAPWLQLPAFDRLRSQSVDLTYALAPGPRTEISIPGFMTGVQYIDQRITSTNDFDLTRQDGSHCGLRGQPTVFKEAESMGARTAVLGVHLPYGRIIGDQTSYCRWWQWPSELPSDEPWLQAAREDFAIPLGTHSKATLANSRRLRYFREELADAARLVADPRYRLIYLHFFPPHLPVMFDARTGRYDVNAMWRGQPYENSLGLADRTMGQLRDAMERAGTWDKTLVIVSADHSFRVGEPLGYPVYPRIPFLCHFPKQSQRIVFGDRANTLLTHDLLLAYLRGQVRAPETLPAYIREWTKTHPGVPLTDTPPGPTGNLE